jgi:hypothetical protein
MTADAICKENLVDDADADAVLAGRLSGLGGLWWFLVTRMKLRAKIEIERERNRAYAAHRDHLESDAELVDYEDSQGRRLWIRKNGNPPSPRLVANLERVKPRYIAIVEFSPGDDSDTADELRP